MQWWKNKLKSNKLFLFDLSFSYVIDKLMTYLSIYLSIYRKVK